MKEIQLMTLQEKSNLYDKLEVIDNRTKEIIFAEFDRLESIIMNYELGFASMQKKHKDNIKSKYGTIQ